MFKKYVLSVCLSFVIYLLAYTFIHEMGHGLIGIFAGGRIERLVLGFNAKVYISNTNYNEFTLPLMNIMGMLLPYFVFLIVTLFYDRNINLILYNVFYGIYVFGILGSMTPWILIPIISIFTTPPPGDDVTKFLSNSGLNPIIIAAVGLLMLASFLLVAFKKGIINNFIDIIKNLRNCQKATV